MSEEVVRQTRSQKRALERESVLVESKRGRVQDESVPVQSGREVKATIKLHVQMGEEPVDMSGSQLALKPLQKSPPPDDVIILSDNEAPSQVNIRNSERELDMQSDAEQRRRVIRQLEEELRLEEAGLILLKKLRQSQTHKETSKQKLVSVAPPPLVKGSASSKVCLTDGSGRAAPPPLVRGLHGAKHGNQALLPPLVRGTQPISVSAQQISSLKQQQNSGSAPPPLVLAPRTSATTVQTHKMLQSGLIRIPSGGLIVSIAPATHLKPTSQTASDPVSRQAEVKLALRKQLEKTLLEIPPPKPVTNDLTFLPSSANSEFIYLLGLEEVVQRLLDSLGRGQKGSSTQSPPTQPCSCSRCGTDFSCRWRNEDGSQLCERCMSSGQKKLLKAQHTGRLKAAFMKALQQEKETELQTTSSSSSSQSISSQHTSTKQLSLNAVRTSRATHTLPHSFPPSSQLQSAVAAAALVNRPGVTMAYVNPSLTMQKTSSAVERQREYLLDMIPSRVVTQAANTWK